MNRIVVLDVEMPDGRLVEAGSLAYETNDGGALISTTWRASPGWLERGYPLCPEMPLSGSPVRSTGRRIVPGAVADTGPDRWGRILVYEAARREASRRGVRPQPLTDADYVLGVDDRTRMGNLRFRDPGSRDHLAPPRSDVPTLVQLPRLVQAAERAERGDPTDDDLTVLLDAGTSMGGARPKVGVRLESGGLALAKLPERDDRWDVEGWEAVALELASRAGLRVPAFTHHRLAVDRSVLILGRFDRLGERRIGYMSADSLTSKDPDETVSYVELAEAVADASPHAQRERVELFDRVAFTLVVNNVDDHHKNHGLLRVDSGWVLAPAFDVNPFPTMFPVESTPIAPGGDRTGRTVDELVDSAPAFGLSTDQASARIMRIAETADSWQDVAQSYGIEEPKESVMSTAFQNENRQTIGAWAAAAAVRASRTPPDAPHSTGWVAPYLRNGRRVSGYRRRPSH